MDFRQSNPTLPTEESALIGGLDEVADWLEQRPTPAAGESGLIERGHTGPRKGVIAVGFVSLMSLLVAGIAPRLQRHTELAAAVTEAKTRAVPVTMVTVRRAPTASELTLPGNIQGFQDTLIYARTTGYVRRWLVEIGDRVQEGQLLAEIESPEVDQELRQAQANLAQARANLRQAQANLELARVSALRWKNLVQLHAVSQQEADVQQSTFEARKADVQAAQAAINSHQANVQRLLELQGFERVVAPFAGVITARTAEVGALITAGGSPTSQELFRLAQIDPLRIYVNVPQTFVTALQVGQPAGIMVRELPQQTFTGTVTRTANALDAASRTLLTEVQLANPEGTLLPGMYVQVQFALARSNSPFLVPANALVVRTDGPQVALERRPDVVEAERLIAAANARIGVAQATFFPTIVLTSAAGFESADIGKLFLWPSAIWAAGPHISFPVFEGGRLTANLQAAQAQYEQAVATYRQQILVAFQEVEDALARLRVLAEQAQAQARAVAAARQTAVLANIQYREGLASYINVVDAERAALDTERAAIQILGQRVNASVRLVKAFGGGWHTGAASVSGKSVP